MPGFLLDVSTSLTCAHAAQVMTSPGNPRVKILGQLVATSADMSTVTGCPFAPGGAASPCISIDWLVPASRVKAGGQPVVLQTSPALCMSGANVPQGPPILVAGQTRVKGI